MVAGVERELVDVHGRLRVDRHEEQRAVRAGEGDVAVGVDPEIRRRAAAGGARVEHREVGDRVLVLTVVDGGEHRLVAARRAERRASRLSEHVAGEDVGELQRAPLKGGVDVRGVFNQVIPRSDVRARARADGLDLTTSVRDLEGVVDDAEVGHRADVVGAVERERPEGWTPRVSAGRAVGDLTVGVGERASRRGVGRDAEELVVHVGVDDREAEVAGRQERVGNVDREGRLTGRRQHGEAAGGVLTRGHQLPTARITAGRGRRGRVLKADVRSRIRLDPEFDLADGARWLLRGDLQAAQRDAARVGDVEVKEVDARVGVGQTNSGRVIRGRIAGQGRLRGKASAEGCGGDRDRNPHGVTRS